MRKVLFYILAVIVCIIVFSAFTATGIGVFFLAIFWNAIIVRIWKAITKMGEDRVEKDLVEENSIDKKVDYDIIKVDAKIEKEDKSTKIISYIAIGLTVLVLLIMLYALQTQTQ